MTKLVIGLFGIFACAGTADSNASAPIIWIAIGVLISCAITLKGVHELLGLNTEQY